MRLPERAAWILGWLGALAGPGLLMAHLVPVRAVFRFTMPLAEGEP